MDGKERIKRGYTIIETMVYIFIGSIILLILGNLTITAEKNYIENVENLKREDEIDRGILNIRKIFNEINISNFNIYDNKVKIEKSSQSNEEIFEGKEEIAVSLPVKSKVLLLKDEDLIVEYYSLYKNSNKEKLETTNLILKNVKDISFFYKGFLIYMKLHIDEEEYLICL